MTLALLMGLLNAAEAAPTEQYWDLGVTLGMPGGLNATGAAWRGHWGARATAGYGGYSSGASLAALYRPKVVLLDRASHSMGLVWGHTEIAGGHSTYLGAIYEMNLKRGFYMQEGMGVAPRGAVPLVPTFSIGWVKRVHQPEPTETARPG